MGEHKFKNKRPNLYKSRKSRSLITTIVVIVAIGAIVTIDMIQRKTKGPLNKFSPERSKGSAEAPLKIVEFVDFQCTHCKHGSEILGKYMTEYPQGIQLTLRYFPLGQLNSSMSAYYAECASRQGKFWEMSDRMFETQDKWRNLLKVQDYFNDLAGKSGLDVPALQQCVEEKDVRKLVEREKTLGESYFVKSTPTYFINGLMTVGIKELENTLEEYFEKKSAEKL